MLQQLVDFLLRAIQAQAAFGEAIEKELENRKTQTEILLRNFYEDVERRVTGEQRLREQADDKIHKEIAQLKTNLDIQIRSSDARVDSLARKVDEEVEKLANMVDVLHGKVNREVQTMERCVKESEIRLSEALRMHRVDVDTKLQRQEAGLAAVVGDVGTIHRLWSLTPEDCQRAAATGGQVALLHATPVLRPFVTQAADMAAKVDKVADTAKRIDMRLSAKADRAETEAGFEQTRQALQEGIHETTERAQSGDLQVLERVQEWLKGKADLPLVLQKADSTDVAKRLREASELSNQMLAQVTARVEADEIEHRRDTAELQLELGKRAGKAAVDGMYSELRRELDTIVLELQRKAERTDALTQEEFRQFVANLPNTLSGHFGFGRSTSGLASGSMQPNNAPLMAPPTVSVREEEDDRSAKAASTAGGAAANAADTSGDQGLGADALRLYGGVHSRLDKVDQLVDQLSRHKASHDDVRELLHQWQQQLLRMLPPLPPQTGGANGNANYCTAEGDHGAAQSVSPSVPPQYRLDAMYRDPEPATTLRFRCLSCNRFSGPFTEPPERRPGNQNEFPPGSVYLQRRAATESATALGGGNSTAGTALDGTVGAAVVKKKVRPPPPSVAASATGSAAPTVVPTAPPSTIASGAAGTTAATAAAANGGVVAAGNLNTASRKKLQGYYEWLASRSHEHRAGGTGDRPESAPAGTGQQPLSGRSVSPPIGRDGRFYTGVGDPPGFIQTVLEGGGTGASHYQHPQHHQHHLQQHHPQDAPVELSDAELIVPHDTLQ